MTLPGNVVDVLYQDVIQTLPFLQARLEQAQNILNVEERVTALDQIHILFKDTEQLFQRLEAERECFKSDVELVTAVRENRAEFDKLWSVLRNVSDDCDRTLNRAQDESNESESLLRAMQNTMVNIDLSESLVSTLHQQREAIVDAQEGNNAIQSKLAATRYYTLRTEQMLEWFDRIWKSASAFLIGIIFIIVYIKWIRHS